MSNFKCSFQVEWKNKFKWIQEVEGDRNRAYCKLCQYSFNLSNMGFRAVTSHEAGKKHQLRKKSVASSQSVINFLPSTSSSDKIAISCEASSSSLPTSTIEVASTFKESTMDKFLLKENVTKAEIKWCLQAISTHKSLRSASKDASFFKDLFPDSEIAKNMQLSKDKIAYMIVYGISLHIRDIILEKIIPCEYFVLGFDESFNKVSQKQQLDVNVRFWDSSDNNVKTVYFTSAFLGRTTASHLLEALLESSKPLDLKKLIQLSMDGPNVNKKLFKDIQCKLKENEDDPEILNIGSCGLHAVNGAFKAGAVETKWEIAEFLRAVYFLFNKSPARRALYSSYSGSNLFPKKFCSIRWLENSTVAQRAIELIPNLKTFVEGVEREKMAPSNKSYELIKLFLKDNLLSAKLAFFSTVANEMEGFLKEYQADKPLIPFLHGDLSVLLNGLMERFVKKDILKSTPLMKIDPTDIKMLLPVKEIDIGFLAKSCLKKVKAPEKNVGIFKKECQIFLIKCVSKMRESSPLAYALTKALTCFNPSLALVPAAFSQRLDKLLLTLTEKNWIEGTVADNAKKQLIRLTSDPQTLDACKKFKRSNRVDSFWHELLTAEGDCKDALKVLKLALIFSHGNAFVERGFSINSDCLWENMKEESLIARRRVFDYVASLGGVGNVDISKKMLQYVKNARARYGEACESRRKEDKQRSDLLKRKRDTELKLQDLEAKKAKIQKEAQRENQLIDEEINSLKNLA